MRNRSEAPKWVRLSQGGSAKVSFALELTVGVLLGPAAISVKRRIARRRGAPSSDDEKVRRRPIGDIVIHELIAGKLTFVV